VGLGPGVGLQSRVWTAKPDGELRLSIINKRPGRLPGWWPKSTLKGGANETCFDPTHSMG